MSETAVMTQSRRAMGESFWRGAVDMLPMSVGAAPFGLMVGTLAVQAGLDQWDVLMMGMLVFAGAAQFTAIDMWAFPVPVLAIVGVTLLVNLRHVLMSAALTPHIRQVPAWCRWYFLYFLADENWALAMKAAANRPLTAPYLMGLIVPFYINWQVWSVLGAYFGNLIEDPERYGFDYVFTAVFLTLVMGFWRGARSAPPLIASAVTAWLAHHYLPGVWYIFLGGVAGVIVGAITYKDVVRSADHA